ncbi:hypothetical protein, unlikely [Trypanosoma brucei gambiense DAL972]|uniref:Uncharacterized protein n=1 Tax=Trypanosoma brucei gambiense (strain MHOM/CI/86/DAL972) TaxID=679716 RepID=D0A100_TRYB9|nr:hypothetical protein, unlikely [Trypanosoma brucei gambiense DAL972]CBH14942.1 hypothetical protein, unlikely [Trypanosoma brucei gambiense DAL972]|eukprot:XP_011777208.1 hypothetical protein, unlikely [Trypanosoma brucei gambiense DAL972]
MVNFSPSPPPFIVILTISPFIYIYIYVCVCFFLIFDSSLSHRPTFHSIFTIFNNNNNNNKPNISPSTRKAATCSGMGEKRREREKTGWQKEYTRRKWKLALKKKKQQTSTTTRNRQPITVKTLQKHAGLRRWEVKWYKL